jgi:hypothetical protein
VAACLLLLSSDRTDANAKAATRHTKYKDSQHQQGNIGSESDYRKGEAKREACVEQGFLPPSWIIMHEATGCDSKLPKPPHRSTSDKAEWEYAALAAAPEYGSPRSQTEALSGRTQQVGKPAACSEKEMGKRVKKTGTKNNLHWGEEGVIWRGNRE